MAFRSGNPALNPQYFQGGMASEKMTLEGTISKTMTLIGLVVITAMVAFSISTTNPATSFIMLIGGALGGIVTLLIIVFTRPAQPQVLMSMYAILQGLFVGSMSYVVENMYFGGTPGVVAQALIATMGVFFTMLTLYRFRIIQPTEKFTLVIVSMTGALMLVYLLNFIMFLFGTSIPFIHESGMIGIGFSLLATGLASMFLIIDFGVIENGVKFGASKNMEWYGAFGLVVTLIWLYIEMLRLIAKLRD